MRTGWLIFALAVIGCARTATPPTAALVPTPPPTVVEPPPTRIVTKIEVTDYLDGKKLPIPVDERAIGSSMTDLTVNEGGKSVVMAKAKIVALEVDVYKIGSGSDRINQGIKFVYENGSIKYAVVGRVKYQTIDGMLVFFGYEINEVAKQ